MNKNTVFSVAVIFAAAFVASCLENDTNAQSGDLLARIEALEANQPGDKAFSADFVSPGDGAKAASELKPLGTALAFANRPQLSNEVDLRSPTGYLYTLSLGASGNTGPMNHDILFPDANCAGSRYVSGISAYGASQGYVFTITANGGTTWDNPAQFWYVPAGTPSSGQISYSSRLNSIDESCITEEGTTTLPGYAILPNDVTVTGVDSGPVKLPITLQ